ncbi:hypothetical protein SARC_17342, partial [Sphaeroforma arctica JP610]
QTAQVMVLDSGLMVQLAEEAKKQAQKSGSRYSPFDIQQVTARLGQTFKYAVPEDVCVNKRHAGDFYCGKRI